MDGMSLSGGLYADSLKLEHPPFRLFLPCGRRPLSALFQPIAIDQPRWCSCLHGKQAPT